MQWDVTYYDEDTREAWRLTTKRLTVGDGVQVDSEQDAITNRDDFDGRLLLNMRRYPLLKHASPRIERATLDAPPPVTDTGDWELPEDADWQPVDLTEAAFVDLNELFMWTWYTDILRKNPHRDTRYDSLKKVLTRERPATGTAPTSTGTEASEKASDKT